MLPRIRKKHRATPTGRIGLIAADRPADVLPAIGWEGLVNRGEMEQYAWAANYMLVTLQAN